MIENPTKFNKMAAFFAAIAGALVVLNTMTSGFFRLIGTFEDIEYYFKNFGNLIAQLISISANFLSLVSAVAVVLVLLRGKKDLIAAIALVLEVAVAILIYLPVYFFNVIEGLAKGNFSFATFVEVMLYLVSLLGLIVFRGALAYICFTKGKFPGEKLSWLPIAALGLFVITSFLYRSGIAYFFFYLEDGLFYALNNCFYYSFSSITVMELIAAVFLGFAFWIPCTEKAEVPAEN